MSKKTQYLCLLSRSVPAVCQDFLLASLRAGLEAESKSARDPALRSHFLCPVPWVHEHHFLFGIRGTDLSHKLYGSRPAKSFTALVVTATSEHAQLQGALKVPTAFWSTWATLGNWEYERGAADAEDNGGTCQSHRVNRK